MDFNSEIQFSITLSSLEEICFNQLKKKNLTKKPANKLKWDEFRDLSYQSFSTNLKFIQEKKYFQNFIKRLSKKHFILNFFIPKSYSQSNLKTINLSIIGSTKLKKIILLIQQKLFSQNPPNNRRRRFSRRKLSRTFQFNNSPLQPKKNKGSVYSLNFRTTLKQKIKCE